MNNAKKYRGKKEGEGLEISSRKLGDIKGVLHAKIGTIKDRNGNDLIEAEETKKRWQENLTLHLQQLEKEKKYTEYIKKVLMSQIITMVWSLSLEPDILYCEVK